MASQSFNHLFHRRHLEDILEPILMNIFKACTYEKVKNYIKIHNIITQKKNKQQNRK